MKSIRIDNTFAFVWRIMRGDKIESLIDSVDATLGYSVGTGSTSDVPFEITPQGSVRVELNPDIANKLGIYNFVLKYKWPNPSYTDGFEKNTVDIDAFKIVPKTAQADEVTEVQGVTDILIGLRGKAFESSDFTPEEIEGLMRPALEAAQTVDDTKAAAALATQLANTATAEAEEATRQSIASKLLADAATLAANNATAETLQATALTVEATRLSGIATADAIEATRLSIIAKNATIEATRLSDIAKSETIEATRLTNIAKEGANTAAQLANDEAFLASEARSETEGATEASIVATGKANTATRDANAAALYAQEQGNRVATYELLSTNTTDGIEYNEITF